MRERLSHRNAPVCALLVFSAGFLILGCMENVAFADDGSVTTLATPPPPHHFGDRGDLVIPMLGAGFGSLQSPSYSAAGFSITHQSFYSQGAQFRQTFTAYSFTPSADVFIGKHVSIGGDVHFGYQVDAYSNTFPIDRQLSLGFSPRVGYAFPVSDHVTIWPRFSLGINAYDAVGATSSPVQAPFEIVASVDVQLVYAIDRHFYVAFAPSLSVSGFPDNGAYPSEIEASIGTLFSAGFVL